MSAAAEIEKPLTLKGIQRHIILTIVACVILAIGSAFLTANSFYWNTKSDIEDLKKISTDNTANIKSISDQLQQLQTPSVVNQAEINDLKDRMGKMETRMDKIESRMDDIYQILIEIRQKQK